MKASELLRAAKQRIALPGTWCRRSLARNSLGDIVAPESPYAAMWCAVGAMRSVAPHLTYKNAAWRFLSDVTSRSEYIGDWNDSFGRSQGEVLAAFDAAIAKAEAAGE